MLYNDAAIRLYITSLQFGLFFCSVGFLAIHCGAVLLLDSLGVCLARAIVIVKDRPFSVR